MGSGSDPEDTTLNTAAPGVERPSEHRTFLIADIRGYTRYTDEHGDEAAAALAARFAGLVRDVVQARDGILLELRGDEALTIFASARQAVRAAVELQERIKADNLPRGVGIGLDTGEAVAVEGGYRGTALNVAARLCAQAAAGEILATETAVHLAARIEGIRYREPRAVRLKGFESPVRIVGVVPVGGATAGRAVAFGPQTAARPSGRLVAVGAAAIVVVVVAALALSLSLGGRGTAGASPSSQPVGAVPSGSTGASPGSSGLAAAPSAGPSASAKPTANDVLGYKGGLSRTNIMPGPGPTGVPKLEWQLKSGSDMGSPPVVADGLVFAGSIDGFLHVADVATGAEAWSFKAGGAIEAAPTVAGGSVYVTSDDGVFHAIDLVTHAERWSLNGVSPGSVPTVDGETAYVGSPTGRFSAVSTVDGTERWHVDLDGNANRNAVANGTAFVDGENSTTLYAIDLAGGAIRWTAKVGGSRLLTPAVADGTVYVTTVDVAGKNSHVAAIDASSGKELWRFTAPNHATLNTLSVSDSTVYTGSEAAAGSTVWAVDRKSGKSRWSTTIPEGPLAHPAIAGDLLYVTTGAGGLYELSAVTGKEVWKFTIAGVGVGPAVVTGGLVLVSSAAGVAPAGLEAIGSETGLAPSIPSSAVEWVADLTAGDGKPALYLNVALDAVGNVYGADRVRNRVVIWDRNGQPTSWGKHGSKPGQFDFSEVTLGDQSESVAIAPDGRIAVGDGGNHRVQIFDRNRRFLMAIGHEGDGDGEFTNPCCVAFGPDGRLFVADPGRNDIQVFDKHGKFVRVIGSGGSGNGQFARLGVPYIDPATSDLWVPDYANKRIEVMTADGTFLATYGDEASGGPGVAEVNGVVLDRVGRMYLVDGKNFVYILDPSGRQIARLGDVPDHGYVAPSHLALTGDGKLYLPDTNPGGNRVVVLQLHEPLWPPD